jgi:hypothetical protein
MRAMTHWMTSIDRLMPEVENARRRTRAAVVRAAGAMLVALAVQVGGAVAHGYHIARPIPADELERWVGARTVAV